MANFQQLEYFTFSETETAATLKASGGNYGGVRNIDN